MNVKSHLLAFHREHICSRSPLLPRGGIATGNFFKYFVNLVPVGVSEVIYSFLLQTVCKGSRSEERRLSQPETLQEEVQPKADL